MSQNQPPAYRPDIDGLRTIAVLSVLAFHAFPELVHGGFVGVDVFFVISGFLIGTIIFKAFESDSFSYRDFYSRRIRRLFPALILVLAFCFAVGWYILLPAEFAQLGRHIVGGVAFVANLVNWSEAGYFDNAAETKPLLHLWSLGIEEQFYIIFPLVVAFAARKRRHYLKIVVLVAVASFVYSIYAVHDNPTGAFYSPLSRFWELMVGCLLAYAHIHMPQHATRGRAAASIAGPVVILLSAALIKQSYPFPGALALLPTLGAALVIYAGRDGFVNRHVLSTPLFVGVGLISYPLYLWHWCLLSFCRILAGRVPSLEVRIGAVCLSFVLAWLTYVLVEKPIRHRIMPTVIVTGTSVIMAAIAVAGLFISYRDGLPARPAIAPYVQQAAALYGRANAWTNCPTLSPVSSCLLLEKATPPTVALVGDSHAAHLLSGIEGYAKARQINVLAMIRYGCMPLYTLNGDPHAFHPCSDEKGMDAELNKVLGTASIKTIIMSGLGFWMAAQDPAQFENAMAKTLQTLAASGKQVVFVVDVPSLAFDPKECLQYRPMQFAGQIRKPCIGDATAYRDRQATYLAIVRKEQQKFPAVRFVYTSPWFIQGERIMVQQEGELLYSDSTHLTPAGSRYLIGKIGVDLFGS